GATGVGVGRRVVGEAQAADDAFQVTFLTLACKARSLRRRQAVGGWLYRVAYHVALRARARRRREVERGAAAMPRPEPTAEVAWRELAPVLDAELARLPEKYRGPV